MRILSLAMAVVLTLSVTNDLFSQEAIAASDELSDKEQKELLKSYYRTFATRTSLKLASGATPNLLDPVYNWVSQDPAGFASGDVFVWEHKGSAAVIGCIGSYATATDRFLFQEYHVLGREPLAPATLEVAGEWAPEKAGTEPKPVDDVAAASPKKAIRLAQMRRIAKDFQPFLTWARKEQRLRLQPTPMYRYNAQELKKAESAVIDGAIFAYVRTVGTDPEMLVVLECHKTDDGLRWMYVPVRFTYERMRLEYQEKEIWRCLSDNGSTMRIPYVTTSAGRVDFDAIAAEVENAKPVSQ